MLTLSALVPLSRCQEKQISPAVEGGLQVDMPNDTEHSSPDLL